jgi:hypothetical protein
MVFLKDGNLTFITKVFAADSYKTIDAPDSCIAVREMELKTNIGEVKGKVVSVLN